MAIHFDTKKYEQIKAAYLKFLETGSANVLLKRDFATYKSYLNADENVRSFQLKLENNTSSKDLILEFWSRKVNSLCDTIKRNGISKKRIKTFITDLENADIKKQTKNKFILQVHTAYDTYKQSLIEKIRQNKILREDFFTISFVTNDNKYVNISHKNIINLIENKTLDKLNPQQFNFLKKTIDKCIDEFHDVLMIQNIAQRFNDYAQNERKKERIRIRLKSKTTNTTSKINQTIDTKNIPITEKKTDVNVPQKNEEPKEIHISWKDINFYINKIRISTPIVNKPILIKKTCKPSYNNLKKLLAEKLPEITIVQTREGVYKLTSQIPLEDAIALIQRRETDELFDDNVRQLARLGIKNALLIAERDQELLMRRLTERKQRYINYLISLHVQLEYKVIPAIEFLVHESSESVAEEDAFIFTIPSRHMGCVCIVYENINVARASLLFVVKIDKYMDGLQSIFNFMSDEKFKNKREFLRAQPCINAPGIVTIHHINHTEDMHDWIESLKRI